jgi:hypothetical protein
VLGGLPLAARYLRGRVVRELGGSEASAASALPDRTRRYCYHQIRACHHVDDNMGGREFKGLTRCMSSRRKYGMAGCQLRLKHCAGVGVRVPALV